MLINLHPRNRKVVVAGGGSEALRKIIAFMKETSEIIVISETFNSRILSLAKQKKIVAKKMKIRDGSFISEYRPFIVVAATNDAEINRRIIQESKKRRIISYSVDDPASSDFSFLSVVNVKGVVEIGISTGGKSPIVAKKIRKDAAKRLGQIISDEEAGQIRIQEIARKAAKKVIADQTGRKRFLYSLLTDRHIKQLIKEKKFKRAEARALEILSEWR